MLGVVVNEKSFETRLADLIRKFGTEFEGEAIATWRALGRLLAARDVSFTDLGDAVEKLATGGLEEAEMQRVFDAGFAKGSLETERKQMEGQAVYGQRPDGGADWEAIALHCQREKSRLEAKHHQFVDDMASRMTWGREPTEKQGKYLISVFRQLGGRMSMTVTVDEDAVREFITIISAHACELAKTIASPGVLQLTRLNCRDEKLVPTRFLLDDVEGMVKTAVNDANAGFNVYVEPRTRARRSARIFARNARRHRVRVRRGGRRRPRQGQGRQDPGAPEPDSRNFEPEISTTGISSTAPFRPNKPS